MRVHAELPKENTFSDTGLTLSLSVEGMEGGAVDITSLRIIFEILKEDLLSAKVYLFLAEIFMCKCLSALFVFAIPTAT